MQPIGTVYISLLVLTPALGLAMLGYTLRRRAVTGAGPLALMIATMTAWVCAALGEAASSTLEAKLFFYNLREVAVVSVPVFWTMLAYEIYRQEYWRRWRLLAILFIVPALTVLLAFTSQPILRPAVEVVERFGIGGIDIRRGPWIAISTAYLYSLYLFGIVLMIDITRRTVPAQRGQTRSILIGIVILVVGNLSDVLRVNPFAPLVPIALTFTPVSLCLMWGLFRQRLPDVLPVARDRVLDAIADGVVVVNGAGHIVDLNRAARAIFYRSLPASARDLIGRDVSEALNAWPEWAVACHGRPRFQVSHGHGDDRLSYEVEVTPLTGARNETIGQIMVMNDITAHKKAFDLQAEHERILVLQRFIRDASHDLRTPMSVLQSTAYVMKRLADKQIETLATLHPKLPSVYAAHIEDAIDMTGKLRDRAVASDDAARRLWSILSGMIELAEMETSGALEPEGTDLTDLVDAVIKARRGDAERHEVTLTFTPDAPTRPIIADEKRLIRAIDAVVLNALQYTQPGGSVDVESACDDSAATVVVKDTGMGIGEDDIKHIFDRFFRADRARSTETGGAGLGLPLARSIIEAHGGKITVESEFGIGSVFRLTFPLSPLLSGGDHHG
jgi:signal transduction histidine kinase